MKLSKLFLAVVATLFMGCNTKRQNFEKKLPGTWEIASFKVEVVASGAEDTSFVLTVDEDEWDAKLGLKPTRVFWLESNLFESQTLYSDGSPAEMRKGMWRYHKDSLLIMIEPSGTTRYNIDWKNPDEIVVVSKMDWDQDGVMDDKFEGRYKRLPAAMEAVEVTSEK